eukprot:9167269-Alexandrium_andersonii.AAC.1
MAKRLVSELQSERDHQFHTAFHGHLRSYLAWHRRYEDAKACVLKILRETRARSWKEGFRIARLKETLRTTRFDLQIVE